jgi:hypothetical protein
VRIYVASSWRNERQPEVVKRLREASPAYDVYDFREPTPGDRGFHWSDIDPWWQQWTPEQFRQALEHPIARRGFELDMAALRVADIVVLVMPCGRSAHLEFGYGVGCGARTVILLSDGEPELMYRMASEVCTTIEEVIVWIRREVVFDEVEFDGPLDDCECDTDVPEG